MLNLNLVVAAVKIQSERGGPVFRSDGGASTSGCSNFDSLGGNQPNPSEKVDWNLYQRVFDANERIRGSIGGFPVI